MGFHRGKFLIVMARPPRMHPLRPVELEIIEVGSCGFFLWGNCGVAPWAFRGCVGDEILPSYVGIMIGHGIRIHIMYGPVYWNAITVQNHWLTFHEPS